MEPTTRELHMMFENLDKKFDEKTGDIMSVLNEIKIDVKETKTQAFKTNGRVLSLEEKQVTTSTTLTEQTKHVDSLRLWRNLLVGGGLVLAGIGLSVVTLFLTLYRQVIIQDSAQKASEQVVQLLESKYAITIK